MHVNGIFSGTLLDPDGNQVSAVFWDPPPEERYNWKFPRPAKPRALRIYECHVGMSSENPHITSFNEFTNQVRLLAFNSLVP